MSKIEELSAAVENGKSKLVPNLVQECLDEGDAPLDVLNHGMIDAMSVVGEKVQEERDFRSGNACRCPRDEEGR